MPHRLPALLPGDPVAVVAPSSAPRDLDRYRAGLERLRTLYDVRTAWQPGTERGYLAASDADRLRALNTCLGAPDLHGIFCVRGGYGALRLLAHLDYDAARTHPKLLVGYSDVTALHLALYHRCGWIGLSGPVVTEWAVMDDAAVRSFRTLAEGTAPVLTGPTGEPLRPMRPGTAAGPLLGGNLSVLTRLLGTPYCPDFAGALLFLEDVGEAPYRVDRMLAHLQLAGVLDAVAGVVLGRFSTGTLEEDKPTLSLETVFADYFGGRPYPVARGLTYGHLMPRITVPVGAPARLAVFAETATLTLDGPVVEHPEA